MQTLSHSTLDNTVKYNDKTYNSKFMTKMSMNERSILYIFNNNNIYIIYSNNDITITSQLSFSFFHLHLHLNRRLVLMHGISLVRLVLCISVLNLTGKKGRQIVSLSFSFFPQHSHSKVHDSLKSTKNSTNLRIVG